MDLSVVAASRNDDHGGGLLSRMQYFVSGLIEQCKRHDLKAELILVEWNPPKDKPRLKEALSFPLELGPCNVRIITVPEALHRTFAHSQHLPLFQMIAKNVGICRAQGKYVLATNIDILFSDSLMQTLKNKLKEGYFYRVDRLDVPNTLPPLESFDSLLTYCANHHFRKHENHGTQVLKNGKWIFLSDNQNEVHPSPLPIWWNKIKKAKQFGLLHNFRRLKYRLLYRPHTNACGDFTLLSLKDWKALHGYPEIQGYSWHIDSLFIYQALKKGIKQKVFPSTESIYHIEHGAGSGFTPENPHLVFERMKANHIPYLDDQALFKIASKLKKPYTYNGADWGLMSHKLEEEWIESRKQKTILI